MVVDKAQLCTAMQGCALVFARIPSLVLLRKTLGKALDCFPSGNHDLCAFLLKGY